MSIYFFSQPFFYFCQGMLFFTLTFLLWLFYRGIEQQYVKFWLFSLFSLCLSYLLSAVELALLVNHLFSWLNLLINAGQKTCQYLFVTFLLLGLYGVKYKKEYSIRFILQVTSAVIVFSTFTVYLYAFDPSAIFSRFYLRESLPAFIFGCSFLVVSLLLIISPPYHLSVKIFVLFSLLVGVRYLLFSFGSIVFIASDFFRQILKYLPFFDAASHSLLGFSLLIWTQGAERKSASLAIDHAKYLGKHDALTGLMNREQVLAKLPKAMQSCQQRHSSLAIFLIDIKRFKFINDTYGLSAGDYILEQIAARLNASVLSPVLVGRLSGDLFVYAVEIIEGQSLESTAKHLHELLERSYFYEHREMVIHCRLGYSVYPQHSDVAEELLKKSNLALFHASSQQQASVMFAEGMEEQGRHLLVVERELKRALNKEEFVLHFQPQLNLLTNRLEGVEALIRWQHPEKGMLYPGHFLDDIDELKLNSLLDEYVLEKACEKIALWRRLYKRQINIAINITAVEFQDERLVQRIQETLLAHDVPAHCLELEITENIVMTDIEAAMDTIVQLQHMGIKVSIDDFGTGYSSLAYLRDLPIDKIKIDRSFIKDVSNNDSDITIVKAMINLSHGLGKRVLAEGVEEKDQLNLLKNIGCDAVQGYYIAKPLSEQDLAHYLKRK